MHSWACHRMCNHSCSAVTICNHSCSDVTYNGISVRCVARSLYDMSTLDVYLTCVHYMPTSGGLDVCLKFLPRICQRCSNSISDAQDEASSSCASVTWLIHVWDTTHSCLRHNSFMSVTWLIRVCGMAYLCLWRDSFMSVTWLMHVCDTTRPCLWHDSFMFVSWLIHVCDMMSCLWHDSLMVWHDPCMICWWWRHSISDAPHYEADEGYTCCSVLQCVAVCWSVLQCVAVCCSVTHCNTLQLTASHWNTFQHTAAHVLCSFLNLFKHLNVLLLHASLLARLLHHLCVYVHVCACVCVCVSGRERVCEYEK